MKNTKLFFSLAGSTLITALLIAVNIIFSPKFLWVIFALPPVIWWPVAAFFGKRAVSFKFAITSVSIAIIYYGLLNILVFNRHPWVIYIAFALIWWPLALKLLVERKQLMTFSAAGTLITIAFFMAVNFITTPQIIWFIFPSFVILWWPLSVYCFVYKKKKLKNKQQT